MTDLITTDPARPLLSNGVIVLSLGFAAWLAFGLMALLAARGVGVLAGLL